MVTLTVTAEIQILRTEIAVAILASLLSFPAIQNIKSKLA
jgi:hypothetical protein